MRSIEAGRRAEATKKYIKSHIASTVLFGLGIAGVGSLGYGVGGFVIDNPQSNPSFKSGEQALEDVNHINSIRNQNLEGFQEIKEELNKELQELTSRENYMSAKSRNDRYSDAVLFGGNAMLSILMAPVIFAGERDNIRRKKEKKLQEGLPQTI